VRTISTLLLLCLVIAGCKKNPFDYRTKFVGDYNCTVHLTTLNFNGYIVSDTTYLYRVKIWYDENETMVSVEYSGSQPQIVRLYEDGSMRSYYVYGEFESTKRVRFRVRLVSGEGGFSYYSAQYIVTGDKAK
jgi:hypothetical protein